MAARDDALDALDALRTECDEIDDPHRSAAMAHLDGARAQLDAALAWIDRYHEQRAAAERARIEAEERAAAEGET